MAERTNNKANGNKANEVKNLYADMRPALVAAHNDGNKKPIDKQRVADLNVNTSSYAAWTAKCKLLRNTTFDYVAKRKALRYGKEVTPEAVKEAREKIYPMWKDLLGFGEKSKYAKELKVDETDVEDLVGFVWDFFDTGCGTAEACVKENVFRRKVEALLGCIIAKNDVLTDDERSIINKYQKAIHRQIQATETIADLQSKIDKLDEILKGIPKSNEVFRAYVQKEINEINEDKSASEEKKLKAEADEKKYEKDAKAIQLKMKLAK